VDSPYDRLVCEIANLECVLGTLSEWDLAGKPTGTECRIGSAELSLRGSISRLHALLGSVSEVSHASA
jgi:hypothetical protein